MDGSEWITHTQRDAQRARLQLAQFVSTLPNDSAFEKLRSLFGYGKPNKGFCHNTERVYQGAQQRYIVACTSAGIDPLCPTSDFWFEHFVGLSTEVLDDGTTRRAGTSYRYAYALCRLFDIHGLPSPTRTPFHRELLVRIAQSDSRVTRKAKPLVTPASIALVEGYDGRSLESLRDRSIAAFGVNRGFRSATIVGFRIQDIAFDERGVRLGIRENKTNRVGEVIYTVNEHSKGHRACLVCSLRAYIEALREIRITSGPLFRGIDRWDNIRAKALCPKSITILLHKGLARAGIDDPTSYSSHSYRHGVVHTAVALGWSLEDIQLVTLHRSLRGLASYINGVDPWYFAPRQLDLSAAFITRAHQAGFVHGA